jgi:type II secretory pathway pseudopilin PulG
MVGRSRGFTVVEVSLVMLLTLVLMTLMASYFVRGKHYAAETETYSSAQRSANALLRHMADDIYRSSDQQLDVKPGSVVFLSFAPATGGEPLLELQPGTGKILWKKWVGYYHDATSGTIYRGELPLSPPIPEVSTPAQPATDALLFRTEPAVRRQPMPGQIRSFSVAQVGRRVRFRLTTWGRAPIVTNTDAQRDVEVSVETEIALLN